MNFRTADRKLVAKNRQEQAVREAARQARNAYARAWRAKNPDKVKQYNADYWARKAARSNGEEIAAQGG